eukprot:scaffold12472_cov115-Cylindrotheca_fusiformis.AAC.5
MGSITTNYGLASRNKSRIVHTYMVWFSFFRNFIHHSKFSSYGRAKSISLVHNVQYYVVSIYKASCAVYCSSNSEVEFYHSPETNRLCPISDKSKIDEKAMDHSPETIGFLRSTISNN